VIVNNKRKDPNIWPTTLWKEKIRHFVQWYQQSEISSFTKTSHNLMFDFVSNSENSLLIVCNFHRLLVPQGRSSYHISHQNMVINFMWVHKWNINHVNKYIYFRPKNWNNITMKLVNPPRPLILLDANFCLLFLGFSNITNCPRTNRHPYQKLPH
jgi:hypothetical protein